MPRHKIKICENKGLLINVSRDSRAAISLTTKGLHYNSTLQNYSFEFTILTTLFNGSATKTFKFVLISLGLIRPVRHENFPRFSKRKSKIFYRAKSIEHKC